MATVETLTPLGTPEPIGPYSHVAVAGGFIFISGTAGIDPATGKLAGPDAYSQARQIMRNFAVMLAAAGSDLRLVVHVNVFLKDMSDFAEMNRAYAEAMGDHRPARTAIGVAELPKEGAVLTMDLRAVVGSTARSSPAGG
ncbi:MAG: RidA family protein [Phycisphaerales bacterium]